MADSNLYRKVKTPTSEANICKVDTYRRKDNVFTSTSYRFTMNSKRFGIDCQRNFPTFEEAKEFKKLILDLANKVRVSKAIAKEVFDYDVVEYPENILQTLGITENEYENYFDDILPNFEERFQKIIKDLSPREEAILLRRFKDLKTYEEIAKDFNVTRERIRQIECKAIRRLRAKKNILIANKEKLELVSQEEVEQMREEIREQIRTNMTIEEAYKIVNSVDKEYTRDASGNYHKKTFKNISIDELNFLPRTMNCLRRSNIHTLEDIVIKHPYISDFMKIRNLGRKSLKEIIDKVKEYGYVVKYPEPNERYRCASYGYWVQKELYDIAKCPEPYNDPEQTQDYEPEQTQDYDDWDDDL